MIRFAFGFILGALAAVAFAWVFATHNDGDYQQLVRQVREACTTGAPAQLDLSNWVPVCKEVTAP